MANANIPPQKPLAPFIKLFDATLIIAAATGLLYFMNCIYMSCLCRGMGINWHWLSMPLPDALVECPALVAIFLASILLGIRDKEKARFFKIIIFDFSSLQNSLSCLITGFSFIACAAVYIGLFDAWGLIHYPNDTKVSFTAYGRNIEDYSLFTRNGEYYYFFKPTKGMPVIRIIATGDVSNLMLRPENESH